MESAIPPTNHLLHHGGIITSDWFSEILNQQSIPASLHEHSAILSELEVGRKKCRYAPFSPLSPFPSPALSFFLPLPCPPCPPLPLELGPLNSARGMGSPGIFWPLRKESGSRGRDNYNDFPDNQVIKFRALQSEQ